MTTKQNVEFSRLRNGFNGSNGHNSLVLLHGLLDESIECYFLFFVSYQGGFGV